MPISEIALELQVQSMLDKITIAPEFERWAIEILNRENDKELETQEKVRSSQQAQKLNVLKQIDELTQMRYKRLIDDDEFTAQRKSLKASVDIIDKEIRQYEERSKNWFTLTENTFKFASSAKAMFETGDYADKQRIFTTLGSNHTLFDGKLSFTPSKWLVPIQNDYPALEARLKDVRTDKAAGLYLETTALS